MRFRIEKITKKALLEGQIGAWVKELAATKKLVTNITARIADGRVRLANLKSFESDTAALAHVIKDKFGQDLSDAELNDLVKQAGISMS